jgi:hypothetical protein
MVPKEIATADLEQSADEIAWRHVWLTNVLVDPGRSFPVKIARPRVITRMTLSRRLEKLHRMRAALERPRSWMDAR